VIVWQVVSKMITNAQGGASNQEKCLGVVMSVTKASSAIGNCVYSGDEECGNALGDLGREFTINYGGNVVLEPDDGPNVINALGACPSYVSPINPAFFCHLIDFHETTSGNVVVQRQVGNPDTKLVKGSVYLSSDGGVTWKFNQTSELMGELASKTVPISGLKVGDMVKVVTVLDNDFACSGESASSTVVAGP
jgi:hypothetical protein